MNKEQKEKLVAFAATANWSMLLLHDLDVRYWEEFITVAKARPEEIKNGEVYGVIKGVSTNPCPDEVAGHLEFLCCEELARDRSLFAKIRAVLKRLVGVACMMLPLASLAEIAVSDVEVFSCYPWQEIVIGYTITGNDGGGCCMFAKVTDNKTAKTYSAYVANAELSEGRHAAKFSLSSKISTTDATVSLLIYPPYLVIDLSAGSSASSYPATPLFTIPGGVWNDTYKTTKLVLRLIKPGTFKMLGSYSVTLTKPFYIGVFEVTQSQFELVAGSNPSDLKGDKRPVEQITSSDSGSFLAKLGVSTGIDFTLPTEAQWEYACRAGTTSDYNNGGSSENDLKKLGRYSGNQNDGKGGYSNGHTTVGSYLPNAWGLYDMHGNVREKCQDRFLSSDERYKSKEYLLDATDPVWLSGGVSDVSRGGKWDDEASRCKSGFQGYWSLSNPNRGVGFRLSWTLSE